MMLWDSADVLREIVWVEMTSFLLLFFFLFKGREMSSIDYLDLLNGLQNKIPVTFLLPVARYII